MKKYGGITMGKNRYESMSGEELKELSKQRVKKTGCFSKVALAAQKELWKRFHWDATEQTEFDTNSDRELNDIQ